MAALRRLSAAQRRLLLALFACAMLVRALVPAGWMPSFAAGQPGLMLCDGIARPLPDGAGMAAVHRHAERGGQPGEQAPAPQHPCAFAGAAAAIEQPALAVPIPPAVTHHATAVPLRAVAVGQGLAAPPPPPTGPPFLA